MVATLDSLMKATCPPDKPGAALLVVVDGKTVYQKGFGLADLSTKQPIDPATTFRMASVSKQFTAMCINLLEQQGKLSYDDNLRHFFPNFNPVGNQIKVRHLLTHSSGLLDYEAVMPAMQLPRQISDQEVLALVAPLDSTYFEPGKAFRYSNTGFVLLALIVEKISGKPYETFIQEQVFKPAGMTATAMQTKGKPIPHRAMGYARNEQGEIVFSDQSTTSATKGDGCVYTSLSDYQHWHQALSKPGKFAIEPTFSKVSFPLDNRPDQFYGMGWFFAKRKNGSYEMFHTGNTCGFSNFVMRIPEKNLLVAYFSNTADNDQAIGELLRVIHRFPQLRPETDLLWSVHGYTR
jgi:CubicO group peptidase (beta-lactamase class C family)